VVGGLRLTPLALCALTTALLVAALQRSPSRLVANLVGYGLLAWPLIWLVQRRAGAATATRVAGALAVIVIAPTHLNLTRTDPLEATLPGSPFRWTAGWAAEGWTLRHQIRLDAPAARGVALTIPLAGEYAGESRVFATVNGRDLGPATLEGKTALRVEVPAPLIAGETLLTFDLRQQPWDRALRLRAQRWTSGATTGAAASSYYDAEHWWPGTFDAAGRRRPGVYVVRLEPLS
jgi:hypothetical protein